MRLTFPPFEPVARGLWELITPKQMGFVRALARDCGADPEEEARRHYGCPLEECSKEGASRLIDHLRDGSFLQVAALGPHAPVEAVVTPDGILRPA